MHKVVAEVTARLEQRSARLREKYLKAVGEQRSAGRGRDSLPCSNIAHAAAGMSGTIRENLITGRGANLGIVSAYNDMVSAHCPYAGYPDEIKKTVESVGASAQVAGCVPAMCDGITQGTFGMDMSLFSRDIIAQSVAVALSHNVFDAVVLLGICDKIAPGMLMGAAAFAHLPVCFIPSGPMASGLPNREKTEARQLYAAGRISHEDLQRVECRCYHQPGTCTFFGTANTNQLVLEAMGLMLPGSAFVPFDADLRPKLTAQAALDMAGAGAVKPRPLCEVLTAKNLINGVVALLAAGGSTNHTLHMPAIARSAGFLLRWEDIGDLSEVVPLLARLYPNGPEDINAFAKAGGVPVLMKSLAARGLLHEDVQTVFGSFADQLTVPKIQDDGKLTFVSCGDSADPQVLISEKDRCFRDRGGLRVLNGNLGQSVIKISAVAPEHHHVKAPAMVFDDQYDVQKAYKEGRLNRDAVIVVRYAGPAARGMPELHKLMPVMGNLQKAGYHVALLTDGRLSGASGGIPSALHVSPEAARGGPIALLQDGDLIDFDADKGEVNCLTSLEGRTPAAPDPDPEAAGITFGRDLFRVCRRTVAPANHGASFLFSDEDVPD